MTKTKQRNNGLDPYPKQWKEHLDHLHTKIGAAHAACNDLQYKLSEKEGEVEELRQKITDLDSALTRAHLDYEMLSGTRWFQVIMTGLVCLTLCSVLGLAVWEAGR